MTAEKRPLDQEKLTFQNISSIIVDIEGTTTSISFVHDTLFPYVREHLNEYVKSNWTDSEFQEDLKALKEQAEKDVSEKMEGVVAIAESEDEEVVREAVIKNVLWQMDNDRKTAALKQLQGHIWRKAYEKGEVVGHIYDDVHECLKSWVADGIKVYVYSSGSVEAQKLLFGHTKEGDLLELFSGHFDTAVGAKTEAASYTKIMEQIEPDGGSDRSTKSVLFLTDIPKEAAAAKEAGMQAVLVAREGNAALTDDAKAAFKVINSFADLSFEGNCKRRKVSESDANTNSAVNVDTKEALDDVDMKEAHDESTEQKTGDSTKDENDSAETKMDTSEAVDTEAKDQVCARKPVEATEEKSEVCARKPVEATEEKSEVCARKPVEATEEKSEVCARKPVEATEEKSEVCARKPVKQLKKRVRWFLRKVTR
ncbi:enolase-phosphatase E1 isoform X2 [Nilaparvata lugens]|uniref:enolase-phosphatase E1 isoform X2 n=1 Tax=Nilaparvata lugens TaxID=108931 RepID=UPI00193C9B47|nr:enolase-phosphatase E1 isoform X2 [Nilaparvata lugens]